jgi:hypothetical protein
LGVELLFAEVAMPARDIEGYDHSVTWSDVLHISPNLLDDSHRLVPNDIALPHNGKKLAVKMQVRAADGGRGYANYGVRGLLDDRVRYVIYPDIFFTVPHHTTAFMVLSSRHQLATRGFAAVHWSSARAGEYRSRSPLEAL